MKFILPFLLLAVASATGTSYVADWLIPRFADAATMPLPLIAATFSTLWVAGWSFRSTGLKVLSMVVIGVVLWMTTSNLDWPMAQSTTAVAGAVFILVILPFVWNAIVSGVLHLAGWVAGDANMLYDASLELDPAYD